MTETQIPYWFLYLCFGGMIFAFGLFAKAISDKLVSKPYNGDERRKAVTLSVDESTVVRFIEAIESHAKATQMAANNMDTLSGAINEHIQSETMAIRQIDDLYKKLITGSS